MSGGDNGAPMVTNSPVGEVLIGVFSYYSYLKEGSVWIEVNGFIRINEQLDFIANNTGIVIRP